MFQNNKKKKIHRLTIKSNVIGLILPSECRCQNWIKKSHNHILGEKKNISTAIFGADIKNKYKQVYL